MHNRSMTYTLIIKETVPTICAGQPDCACPIVTESVKACDVARVVNAFITPEQPVRLELNEWAFALLLSYFAVASLRRR